MKRGLLPLAVISTLLFSSPPSLSTTMISLTLTDLSEHSGTIFHGIVRGVRYERDREGRRIYTYIECDIIESFKGAVGEKVLFLRLPGGRMDGLIARIHGVPPFEEGEEVIVFAQRAGEGSLIPTGLFQGKFNVLKEGGEKFVLQEEGGEGVSFAGARGKVLPHPIPLRQFREMVMSLVKGGEDR